MNNFNARSLINNKDYGLTKREYFAALALQAMISNPNSGCHAKTMAECALEYADALIIELEEKDD